jgi:hypothetical protein
MMSPFFGNPAFVAATHDERTRRLREHGRLRAARARDTDRRRAR